ncbi:MAG: toll/interleukin-1 receptor domain-containing protein [Chlorobaculum sp.]|jgi:TPR repeat protein|nr:toll/interleukin-1 receptor domain-containing protein [Chlorobaculum sp.]
MSDIFISYAREDRPKAQQLAEVLERQGWSVWWDIAIPAGQKFGDVISEKLSQADVIVVLWSAISVKRDWVLDEAQIGKKRNILIPVFIESVDPPLGYGQIHAANLVGWNGSPSAPEFIRLVRDIERIAGSPKGSPASPNVPGDGSAKRGGASVDPIEIKIPQRMVNLPVLSAKIRRNSVIAILLVGMLIIGGIFIANRSDSSSETQIPATATVDGNTYAEGVKLYDAGKYDEAYPLFLKAAEQGDANAQCYIGVMYDNGYGVAQNYVEAEKWYRKSAEQGNSAAQFNLGLMYDNGKGVAQNYEEAVKWYRKSADQGNADGQANLGFMYEKGLGLAQNYEEAVKWYRKSAEQGNADGQANLGWMYEFGKGVAQSNEEAVKWYRKSAEQGDADGQYDLGYMYEYGKGVKRNKDEAIKWYRLSAKQGNTDAQKNLKRLGETW